MLRVAYAAQQWKGSWHEMVLICSRSACGMSSVSLKGWLWILRTGTLISRLRIRTCTAGYFLALWATEKSLQGQITPTISWECSIKFQNNAGLIIDATFMFFSVGVLKEIPNTEILGEELFSGRIRLLIHEWYVAVISTSWITFLFEICGTLKLEYPMWFP